MEARLALFTLALCLGLTGWLLIDVKSARSINYQWHSYLINSTTGQTIKPTDVYDLSKIINVTEDYVNTTNALDRLYDLEYNINLENPFSADQVYSNALELVQSGLPVSNQTQCGDDLKWIQEQLTRHPDYPLIKGRLGMELTQFMDSFGKPEAGLYSGLVTWMGSNKQCRRTQLNGGAIGTRFCIARLRPRWWPKNETVTPRTRIKMGVCLPETCDTMSFNRQRQAIEYLIKFDLSSFYQNNLEFESLFCLPDERSPIRQIPLRGLVFLGIIGGWLTLVMVASIAYEVIMRRQRKSVKESMFVKFKQEFWEKGLTVNGFLGRGVYDPSQRAAKSNESGDRNHHHQVSVDSLNQVGKSLSFKLLESMSIHHSVKEFKSNRFADQQNAAQDGPESKVRVNLCCLSAVKFIMALTVVLAHSCYLNSVYTRSLYNRVDLSTQLAGKMVLSTARCVDTFFIFFGLLTSYTLLKKFTVEQLASPIIWIGVNAGVMLRIGPIFMLVYWYSKLISPYTGEGPWWDYGVYRYSMKGNCMSEPWWKSIPYFGCSGSPPVASCVLPSWFLVTYSQLSLIMPLMTYILYKLPNHITKWLLIIFTSLIASVQLAMKMYQQTSIREEAFSMYGAFLVDLVEKFESTGTMSTLSRVGCVTTGCYVGYLLKMYEQGTISEWPRWFHTRLTIVMASLMHLVVIFMPLIGHFATMNGRHFVTLDEFITSYSVAMFLWPVLNSILIINAVTVHNRKGLVRFFSHSFWHSANKLGLCIYLVHWEVIFIGITGSDYAPSMGFYNDILKGWSYGVFYSIILSIIIHIMIEAPVASLLGLLAREILAKFSPQIDQSDEDQRRLECIGTPKLTIR